MDDYPEPTPEEQERLTARAVAILRAKFGLTDEDDE